MKQLTLALLLVTLATSAHGADGKGPLFHCGVKLGSEPAVYKPGAKSTASRNIRKYMTRSFNAATPARATASRSKKHEGNIRLPPTLTLANFSCSWR